MTDRHAGYIVTLGKDIRDDDSAELLRLLRTLKGVVDVQPVVADAAFAMAGARVRRELIDRFYNFYTELFQREVLER